MSATLKQHSALNLLDLPVEVNILIVSQLPLPTLDLLLAAHPYFRELWNSNVENKRDRDQRLYLTKREHVDQLIAAAQFDPFYFSKAMLACSRCLKLRHVENFQRPWWGTVKQMRERACMDCQWKQPNLVFIRSLAAGAGWCHQSGVGIARTFGLRCQGCNKSISTRVPAWPLFWMHGLPYASGSIDDDRYAVREQTMPFCARCRQPQGDCFQGQVEFEREIEVEIAKRQRAVFDEERLKRFWNKPAETVGYEEERATWREKLMYLWSVDQEHVLDRRFLYTKPLKSCIKSDCSISSKSTEDQSYRDRMIQAYAATADGKPQYRWPCRLLANSFGQRSEEDRDSRLEATTSYLRTYRTLVSESRASGGRYCSYFAWSWWHVRIKMEKDIQRLLGKGFGFTGGLTRRRTSNLERAL
ncbi:hypothetical protein MMC27_007691 [Xylographa pallens]|nr:hypothetical protein [Xylographa pallens]